MGKIILHSPYIGNLGAVCSPVTACDTAMMTHIHDDPDVPQFGY